jgi:hypothetical protein
MYRAQSLPRQCSEHRKLMNEEINAWEAYDGLKELLANDPVPPELAEELDRRYKLATEAVPPFSLLSAERAESTCFRSFTRFVRCSLNCETTDTNPFNCAMSFPSGVDSNRPRSRLCSRALRLCLHLSNESNPYKAASR